MINATFPFMSINKVAIITGASRGIGRAIARKLYEEGASVALCARSAIDDFPQERSLAVTISPFLMRSGIWKFLDFPFVLPGTRPEIPVKSRLGRKSNLAQSVFVL